MVPARVMRTDTTTAKMGRSMKKRASMTGFLLVSLSLASLLFFQRSRLDLLARLELQEPGHDHWIFDGQHPCPLNHRLFLDHAHAILLELADDHRDFLHPVISIDDINGLFPHFPEND